MIKLFGYWRSSASYRVRIALALKGIDYDYIPVNLRGGEQKSDQHLARNSQGFVPVLELEDGTQITQSIAIIDYLDAAYDGPKLIPDQPVAKAKVLSAALIIASDIAPIQNLSVINTLKSRFDTDNAQTAEWAQHWISNGFGALEKTAVQRETSYLYTQRPALFETCLIPQIYNARRFGVDMSAFPALLDIDARCLSLAAFKEAAPENQIDSPRTA